MELFRQMNVSGIVEREHRHAWLHANHAMRPAATVRTQDLVLVDLDPRIAVDRASSDNLPRSVLTHRPHLHPGHVRSTIASGATIRRATKTHALPRCAATARARQDLPLSQGSNSSIASRRYRRRFGAPTKMLSVESVTLQGMESNMSTTTFHQGTPTLTVDGHPAVRCPDELLERYQAVLDGQRMSWTEHLHLTRRLGSGGQGVVYLSERRGTDNFTLPVALKIFSPARYEDARSLRRCDGPHCPSGGPRGPDSAGQSAGRTQLRRAQPHPHHGNGMDRRLRPGPAADPADARPARASG